jgi:hypothetical protein
LFRLDCCADRGGDLYNLSRALSKHGDPAAPTSGDTIKIAVEEMREMSQKVFQTFKSQYIDKAKNIFDEIDKLTLENVCGKYFDYVNSKIESGDIEDIEAKLSILKSRMKRFIIYQLGNANINQGVNCGYYNIIGKEEENNRGEINNEINKYLFEHCFNPQKNENNYRHFLDYLLINFSSTFGEPYGESKFIPHINEFTKVLDKNKLADYWKEHGEIIKFKNYESEERKIFTGNYNASYEENLKSTFEELDESIETEDTQEE